MKSNKSLSILTPLVNLGVYIFSRGHTKSLTPNQESVFKNHPLGVHIGVHIEVHPGVYKGPLSLGKNQPHRVHLGVHSGVLVGPLSLGKVPQ